MAGELTAVYQEVPEGYIAFVEELPGANTQGATLDGARANLREAVVLVMEANRAMAEEDLTGAAVIREHLRLTAWSVSIWSGMSRPVDVNCFARAAVTQSR